MLAGLNAGAIIDIGYQNFSIQPGLFFTSKGEKFTNVILPTSSTGGGGSDNTGNATSYILNYADLPVNFLYKADIVPDLALHLGGGPYFAYGLTAKVAENGVNYHGSFGNNPSDYAYYKKPDYGINFLAGLILQKKYIVDIQYGLGLGNLSYTSTLQNRVLSFSVGYMFE